jgi:hypothetical protein
VTVGFETRAAVRSSVVESEFRPYCGVGNHTVPSPAEKGNTSTLPL